MRCDRYIYLMCNKTFDDNHEKLNLRRKKKNFWILERYKEIIKE